MGFPQHANGSPPGCPTNSPATQPQENKHRNSWDPPCRVTPTRGWGISPKGNRLPAECVPSTTRSSSVRTREAQGKSAPHRHFAKAMPYENSVLGIQGGESLSTSIFCKGDAAFWASRGANPCRRRHFAKAMPHENSVLRIQGANPCRLRHFAKAMPREKSVLGIQGAESLSTSTFCKGDVARE